MQLADRVQRIKPSPTLAITARAGELRAQGKNIISLSVGEPDFDTPEHIKAAGIKAINEGITRYTPVDGTPALKQAIINKLANENNLEYTADQILVSCGCKHSLYNLTQALLNDGDEVIIPAPYWVSYPDMVALAGGIPVIIAADISQNFKITPQQLADAITDKTRLLFLNSPSNPSGSVYTHEELAALAEVLVKHPQIMIVSDDIYEHIRWTGQPYVNIANVNPQIREQTVVCNGVSKAYAMTGWRIGYAAGPAKLIKAMKKAQSQSTSNPCSISQVAATEALSGPQDFLNEMVTAFKSRHDHVHARLNQMKGIECVPTDGAFYLFPKVEGAIANLPGISNDLELTELLLNEANIAVVPGSAFGCPGYIRISFATSIEQLNTALDSLQKVVG